MIISKKWLKLTSAILVVGSLYGCAATQTSLSKGNLDVQTRMSETIFLEPVAPAQKTVFVQVKNTSGKHQLDLDNQLRAGLQRKGYTVVNDPQRAHYQLQANVLRVGKFNLSQSNSMLDSGFGTGLMTGATAAVLGANGRTAVGIGLAGAAIGMVADALVKDNLYTIVTDVQISERTNAKVKESTRSRLQQGTSTTRVVTSNTQSNYNRYQTRIVSTANKVNLRLEEAVPQLVVGISNSIVGMM